MDGFNWQKNFEDNLSSMLLHGVCLLLMPNVGWEYITPSETESCENWPVWQGEDHVCV